MTTERQEGVVNRAILLMLGFAKTGIIALVDEATGYQEIRHKRYLAAFLTRFLREGQNGSWSKTFPYEFYDQIFRLKGWDGPHGVRRPSVIGHYTNDIVYDRLGPGLLGELRGKNPVLPSGNRRVRHHQWFTEDIGHPGLRARLEAVIAIMKISPDWETFMAHLDRAYPKPGSNMKMFLPDSDYNEDRGERLVGLS